MEGVYRTKKGRLLNVMSYIYTKMPDGSESVSLRVSHLSIYLQFGRLRGTLFSVRWVGRSGPKREKNSYRSVTNMVSHLCSLGKKGEKSDSST